MPKFSILIPTCRGKEALQRVLESVEKHSKDYEIVVNSEVLGFNEKLNKMVKQAQGDYLVFLHDDCEVCEGWLDEVNECGAFHVGEWSDTMQYWGGFYPGNKPCQNPDESPHYAYFNMLSKKVINDVFPLDEHITRPWAQDVDFGFVLKQNGYKFKCLKGKLIHYQSPESNGGTVGVQELAYVKEKWNV